VTRARTGQTRAARRRARTLNLHGVKNLRNPKVEMKVERARRLGRRGVPPRTIVQDGFSQDLRSHDCSRFEQSTMGIAKAEVAGARLVIARKGQGQRANFE